VEIGTLAGVDMLDRAALRMVASRVVVANGRVVVRCGTPRRRRCADQARTWAVTSSAVRSAANSGIQWVTSSSTSSR
jgi:hypothetical protein